MFDCGKVILPAIYHYEAQDLGGVTDTLEDIFIISEDNNTILQF